MKEQSKLFNEVLNTGDKPKIYSHKAIWGFSVFFSSIFGGVLLMQNLRDIGKKKEANVVLSASVVYTIITFIIVNIPEKSISSLTMAFNFVGGYVLSEYFFKNYIPEAELYPRKKIWKPLIISVIITLPLILALVYTLNLEE
jgi:hypothetical protein